MSGNISYAPCIYIYIYRERERERECCTSPLIKFENINAKEGPTLNDRSKINQWNCTLNNRYTPLTVTPADCHEYYQLKLVVGENI